MVKVWLTEIQAELVMMALDKLKVYALEDKQWSILIEEIDRINDEIFHAGKDE